MRFSPRAPREGINVSDTHPLKEAATLVLGLTVILVVMVLVIAWSVDVAVGFVSPQAEARIFAPLRLEHGLPGAVDDRRQAAVQGLLDRLLVHWPDAAYDFRIVILTVGDANAAALPGGSILVTSALLDQIESENELAFVLGHELGHFRHRDHLRRLGRGAVYGLAVAAVAGSSGTSLPDFATVVGDLTARGFDREQERAADRFGLELVQAEYGHIGSSWHFFQRLADAAPSFERLIAYLSTHPASAERIEEILATARRRGWPPEGVAEPWLDGGESAGP